MRFPRWLRNLRRSAGDEAFIRAATNGDGRMQAHRDALEYPGSDRPAPTQAALADLFRRTSSIELLEDGASNGRPVGNRVLFASSDARDIGALEHALELVPTGPRACLCHGDYALVLRDRRRRITAVIGIHHTRSIRWDGWWFDATLKHPGRLADWLVDRGAKVDVSEDELREWSLDRVQRHLGLTFRKEGRAILRSEDGKVVLTLTISSYISEGNATASSFLLRGDQIAKLRTAQRAYAGFVFFSLSRIIIVPYDRIAAAMEGADANVPPDGAHYVVVQIADPGGAPTLELPAFRSRFDVSDLVITLRRPRSP